MFFVPSTDATAIGVGDLVKLAANGGADPITGRPIVTRTATPASDVPVGVVVGIMINPPGFAASSGISSINLPNNNLRPASTAAYVLVCTDPTVVYEAQLTGTFVFAGAAATTATVGKNFSYTNTAPSATTGISGVVVDLTTANVTATLPLKLIALVQRPDNDFSDVTNLKGHLMLNTSSYATGTVGV
jgi:hypothetical protein